MAQSGIISILKNSHSGLLDLHREYLEYQQKTHREYLSVCSRIQEHIYADDTASPHKLKNGTLQEDTGTDKFQAGSGTVPDHAHACSWTIRLEDHPWIGDHSPTYTIPVLPLMYELDIVCKTALSLFPGKRVSLIKSLESHRWAALKNGVLHGQTLAKQIKENLIAVRIQTMQNPGDIAGTETAAISQIVVSDHYSTSEKEEVPELADPSAGGNPYESGSLFHGISLQLMSEWVLGKNGADCRVNAESRGVPYGEINPGMLDASLHCIPFFQIGQWYPDIAKRKTAFPLKIEAFTIYDRFPEAGMIEVQARKARVDHRYFPVIRFWLRKGGRLLATFNLTIVLLPRGIMPDEPSRAWKRFLTGQGHAEGISIGKGTALESVLDINDIKGFDWLPGTLSMVYGIAENSGQLIEQIAVSEHIAQHIKLHPSRITFDKSTGRCINLPLNSLTVQATRENERIIARSSGPSSLDISGVSEYWEKEVGIKINILFDLIKSLTLKFVRRIILEDPDQFALIQGRPALYIANHQTGIESLLFAFLIGYLSRTAFRGIINTQQESGMLGILNRITDRFVNVKLPVKMLVFDQQDRKSLYDILDNFAEEIRHENASCYVTAEGRRAMTAGYEVSRLSSVFIDFAIKEDIPVVPVRFTGGLPEGINDELLDLPFESGQQDYYIGKAVLSSQLKDLAYADRPRYIVERINNLGPEPDRELPISPDPAFNQSVAKGTEEKGYSVFSSIIIEALRKLEDPCDETRELLDRMDSKPDFTGIDRDSLVCSIMTLLTLAR